jgi:hypothetical protein
MTAPARHPAGAAPAPRAYLVEVRTAAGQVARYHAIASSTWDALLDALDLWGHAKINITPRGEQP